jgi:hypothetical protein
MRSHLSVLCVAGMVAGCGSESGLGPSLEETAYIARSAMGAAARVPTKGVEADEDGSSPSRQIMPGVVVDLPATTRPDRKICRAIVAHRARGATASAVPADYDGDGRFDISLKQDSGDWSIDYAANGFGSWDETYAGFGAAYFRPLPGDYDGDCKADLSTKDDDGTWYIDYAANGFGTWDRILPGYGGPSTLSVPADYDGDGIVDLAVKDNVSGNWYIDAAANGFGGWDLTYGGFGGADYAPVPADYDGDGRADLSTKSATGMWLIDYAANGFGSWDLVLIGFGGPEYAPVPADYDGDGKADLSTRDSLDAWYIDYQANGFGKWDAIHYGFASGAAYQPVPADYDGDGKSDLVSHTNEGDWLIDFAADRFGDWNQVWNSFVTVSAGAAVTSRDIAKFDSRWMQQAQIAARSGGACWALYNRSDASAWGINERMVAMASMYESTRQTRYLDHLRDLVRCALLYRDDRHPGPDPVDDPVAAELHRAHPLDEVRGVAGLAAWGGRSLNSANKHRVDEVVSSLYAYPIAAFARIVAEDSTLHASYGAEAMADADAALETVQVFLPQIRSRNVGSFIESHMIHHPNFATVLTASACTSAHASDYAQVRAEFNGTVPADAEARMNQQKSNCIAAPRLAGHPLPHNEFNAFLMVLVELSRVLESPFYRQTSPQSASADWARTLLPLLASRGQRYFANRLQSVGTNPATARFRWNYMDDLPSGDSPERDDASHASVSMGFIALLNRNFVRLNSLPIWDGKLIAFDATYLHRFANSVLHMTGATSQVPANVHMSDDVDGTTPTPADKQDGTCHGFLGLTAGDSRVYQACHAMSLRLKNGTQPHLGVGAHSALLANKGVAYPGGRIDGVVAPLPSRR